MKISFILIKAVQYAVMNMLKFNWKTFKDEAQTALFKVPLRIAL